MLPNQQVVQLDPSMDSQIAMDYFFSTKASEIEQSKSWVLKSLVTMRPNFSERLLK